MFSILLLMKMVCNESVLELSEGICIAHRHEMLQHVSRWVYLSLGPSDGEEGCMP